MPTYTIRAALPADLDALWPVVRRAVAKMNAEGSEQWGADYPTPGHYAADIDRDELLCAVTESGAVLGVACATLAKEPTYAGVPWTRPGPAMVVHRMAVDPQVQRSGVANALFQRAEDLARAAGAVAMHVDTYSKNAKMQALFRKRGYTQVDVIHLHGRSLPYPVFELVL